jgi:drug/metabolite transporter (DMT)-like permease
MPPDRAADQAVADDGAVLTGIAFKLGAVGVFATMAALVKALDGAVPVNQVVFARSFFALIPILWLVHRAGGRRAIATARPLGHALRAVAGLIAMSCGFTALALAPLADVIAIGFAATVFTPILAAAILREQVGVYRWSAVAIGFLGIVVILQPQALIAAEFDGATPGLVIALVGAFFVAVATITVRALATREEPAAIIFWFAFASTLAAGLSLPVAAVWPSPREAALLVGIGVLGGLGQILMTRAYVHAPASVVAPFDYSSLLYATLIGVAVFGDPLAPTTFAGAALIVGAGLVIFYRERTLGLARGRARRSGVAPPSA